MKRLFLIFLIFPYQLFSQSIHGKVYDKSSGTVLTNCNISIQGTNRGTISNNNGFYVLNVYPGNYRLLFQYMGYTSVTVDIKIDNDNIKKDIYLVPKVLSHDNIFIYANQYSEAEQIILRASFEKKKTLDLLKNYSCKSYTKLTISGYDDSLKDTYGLLNEIYSDLVWNKPDYWYEIVKSQKMSANIPESINILNGNTFLDINSERINLGNRLIIGPIASDAINYYSYEIEDTLYQDNNRIFKLKINPKIKNRPLMSGYIFLIDKLFIIMKIDVVLNKQANYEMFEDIHLIQYYKAFNDSVFLPYYSLTESALILSVPGVPKLIYQKTNFREDYNINSVENEKYSGQTRIIFKNEIPFESLSMHIPPLTVNEIKAYAKIDSMVNNNSAYYIFTNLLKLFDKYTYIKSLPIDDFSNFYRFNRVEGNFIGAALNTKNLFKYFRLNVGFGYGFSDNQSKYFIFPEIHSFDKNSDFGIKLGIYKKLLTREGIKEFPLWLNTYYSITKFDYFDYYYTNGFKFTSYFVNRPIFVSTTYFYEKNKQAHRNIFNTPLGSNKFIDNPAINENNLIGLKINLKFSSASLKESPLFIKRMEYRNYYEILLNYETGIKEWGSDYEYNRYDFSLFLKQNTFFKGYVDLTFLMGLGTESLPLQRIFELESGDFTGYDRFKTFRTLFLNSFIGRNKFAVYLEHNFQNTLFNLSGIPVFKNIPWDFSIIYNIGWAGDKSLYSLHLQNMYSEAGFGIGRIANFFKIEFLWSLETFSKNKNFTWTIKTVNIEL